MRKRIERTRGFRSSPVTEKGERWFYYRNFNTISHTFFGQSATYKCNIIKIYTVISHTLISH